MSGSALNSPLRVFSREEAINESRIKGVASTNTIENLKILAIPGLIEIASVIADRAPIVSRCRCCLAKRGGHHLERQIGNHSPDHLLECFRIECGKILVRPSHFIAQCRGEIF